MKKIIILSLMAASAIMADPLVSYPGTKAKGMGGAFTAIANNNSAMYFNPAGMVDFESEMKRAMWTMEGGSGGAFDLEKNGTPEVMSSTFNYFLAGGMTSPKIGAGIAVYSLYSVRARAKDDYGYVNFKDQDISALSASGAYALTNGLYPGAGKISIGATLGVAFSGGGLIEMETTSENGSTTSNYTDDTLDQRGFFGAVGIKARLYNSMTFKVDVGLNYRSAASLESIHDGTDVSSAAVNGMDMPAELSYGVAALYLTEYGVFTVAVDRKTTDYKEATSPDNSDFFFHLNDYETLALGVDLSGPLFQVRAGTYKSEEQTSNGENVGLNISGYTFGGGITFQEKMNLEFSIDNKTYEWKSGNDYTEIFGSISLNFAFED